MTPSKLAFVLGSLLALVTTAANVRADDVQAPERLPMPQCVDNLTLVGCNESLCEPGEGCCCDRCVNCPACCEKVGCCEKSNGCCKSACCEQQTHGSLILGMGLSADCGLFGSILLNKAPTTCCGSAACNENCKAHQLADVIKEVNCAPCVCGSIMLKSACTAAATCKEGCSPNCCVVPPPCTPNCKNQLKPYIIEPPDLLTVELLKSMPERPLVGERLVRTDGTVSLGFYGELKVAGLTIQEAREKIENHLAQFIRNPIVNVDVFSYNSKGVYVVADGAGFGSQAVRLPFTGNETVLDAISQIGGLPPVVTKQKIWVSRPGCGRMPVDWNGIVMDGFGAKTNYALRANDTIYIDSDPELKREVLREAIESDPQLKREVLRMAKGKTEESTNEASDYVKGVAGYVTDLQRALPAVIVFNQTPSLWQVVAEYALSYVLDYAPEEPEDTPTRPSRVNLTANPNGLELEPIPPVTMPVEYRLVGGGPPLPSVRGVRLAETPQSSGDGPTYSPYKLPAPASWNGLEIAVMPPPVPVFQPFGRVGNEYTAAPTYDRVYAPAPGYPVQQAAFHVIPPAPAPMSATPCVMKPERDGDLYVVSALRAGTSMHCTKLSMQMGPQCTIRVAAANKKIVVACKEFDAVADLAEAREDEGKLVLEGNVVLLYRKNGSSCRVEADKLVLDLTQSTLSFQVMTSAVRQPESGYIGTINGITF